MEEKYNAIVIKTAPYKDNDIILTLFTLENGVVSANLKGVKKAGAKLKFAGEPFCFGEYSLVEKSGRRTVTEVSQIDSFYNIRLDYVKYYAAFSCAEFVNKFMFSGMKSYDLFLALVNALKTLNEASVSPKSVLVRFYLEALKYTGYELDFSHCSACGKPLTKRAFFNFDDGVTRCADCCSALDTEIRFSTYEALREISSAVKSGAEWQNTPVSDASTEKFALKFLDFYISQKSGVTIKSHKLFIE
ncbi:MAG: DNA repair protein RecO [Christensenellaceae bacterium]